MSPTQPFMILARPIEFASNLSFPISSGFSAIASSALATDVIKSERSRTPEATETCNTHASFNALGDQECSVADNVEPTTADQEFGDLAGNLGSRERNAGRCGNNAP